tara:strand:+ start:186 stop:482 length:297 start_codon:yes stop_codon:yes gene_type:complete
MANEIRIEHAIISLKPNAKWSLVGNKLEWLDSKQTEPTTSEIATEVTKLQAEYDAKKYQRDRAEAYPSMADQLDDIYHNGVDAWKATIKTIKDKYPKE